MGETEALRPGRETQLRALQEVQGGALNKVDRSSGAANGEHQS